MVSEEYLESLVGKRIELIQMGEDPDPIHAGAIGTVTGYYIDRDYYQLWVDWEHNRGLNLICPPDIWKIKE